MKGEWCYFKSYLNKETCNKIIQDVQLLPWQDGLIGNGEGQEVKQDDYRRSKIKFIHVSFNPLMQRVVRLDVQTSGLA